jgi:flagellar hook-length control protein FliK
MMSDAGIQLGQATINAGMPNQQQQNFGDQTGSSSRGFSRAGDTADSAAPRVIGTTRITGGQGLVDTFA